MLSNDTENIYTTQYGGEGEPIPATKISYDGTGTSIEATSVQGAITEIDTDLQSTKDDVNDIKTAITDGSLLLDAQYKISVNADNVKSISTLLSELITACLSAFGELDDDEFVIPRVLTIGSVATMSYIGNGVYSNSSAAFAPVFQRTSVGSSSQYSYYASLSSTPSFYNSEIVGTPAVTFTNKSSDVLASGEVAIFFYKFKKV